MKQRARIALMLVVALCAGLLCACGVSSSTGSAGVEDNGPMTLFLSREDEWLLRLKDECTGAASEYGYTLSVVSAEDDADKQLQQIKKARTSGESAFLINLVDPSRADEVIEAAGNRKVVFVNRMPEDESVLDSTHVYVGSEESEAGMLQGNVLAEYCQSEGMKTIHYLLLQGPSTLSSSQQRADAVLSAMEETGFDMKPVCDPISGEYDRTAAKQQVASLLSAGTIHVSDVDLVIATDDAMALGALEAMQETDPEDLPIIIGVDGLDDALSAIQDGTMMMTAYQDAERQAETAVCVANNLNHGYEYDQGITVADRIDDYIFWISFQSVTSDNVAEFLSKQ